MALGIALAAQIEVILFGPQEAAAVKVSLDPPNHMLQHSANLAGLQVSETRKDQLIPLLGEGAVQSDRVQMWIEAHVG